LLQKIGISFLIVTGLCLFSMLYLDRTVLLWVHTSLPPMWAEAFRWITRFGKPTFYLIPAVVLFLAGLFADRFVKKQSRALKRLKQCALGSLFLLISVGLSSVLVLGLKFLFGRYRPIHFLTDGHYGFSFFHYAHGMNSFPSGHTQVIWSAMIALSLLNHRTAYIAIPFAILVSVSRVMIMSHYCSDVLMGAWIGISVSVLLYPFKERFEQKRFQL
jgi:membrane-associated phospholipid phosphatase